VVTTFRQPTDQPLNQCPMERPCIGFRYECRLVERILDPHPRIGQPHLENVSVAAGFGHSRKGLVDRIRYNGGIDDARQYVVVDLYRDSQLVPTMESHTDHEFVNIAEHMGSAHRPVDVDLR
jgi:hypothetical protein